MSLLSHSLWLTTALAITSAIVAGCQPASDSAALIEDNRVAYRETGDLDALHRRGILRILVHSGSVKQSFLPYRGSPLEERIESAAAFALAERLTPLLVYIDHFQDLAPALLEGRGDIIAADLGLSRRHEEHIAFTMPVRQVRHQIVARIEDEDLGSVQELRERTIAVMPGTRCWRTIEQLRRRYPQIGIEALPDDTSIDRTLDRVARGDQDLTVVDSGTFAAIRADRPDLHTVLDLSGDLAVTLGVRRENRGLLRGLNRFLKLALGRQPRRARYFGDLPAIQRRNNLRLATRVNGASFYVWQGRLSGFDYELATELARQLGVDLEVIVAPGHNELLPMLLRGEADLAVGFLTPTQASATMEVSFSVPYHFAASTVVTRPGDASLHELSDLNGRTFHVRRSSVNWEILKAAQANGIGLRVRPVPEDMETEAIIDGVASGRFDLTLAARHLVDVELGWRDDIRPAFSLNEHLPQCWATRSEDRNLKSAVDAFFSRERRGTIYNVLYQRYFQKAIQVAPQRFKHRGVSLGTVLSPYDRLVRKHAARYGFDWRLIVAQMYEESRFDPQAVSWAGARGLMQIMPSTAQELGVSQLDKPEIAIRAGIRYLNWVRDQFETELPVRERLWFTLAAYNVGVGHLQDARRLAKEMGWDPDRWFGQVEQAFLLLAQPQYAGAARHGPVRATETVDYVRQVKKRFEAYAQIVQTWPTQVSWGGG
jgi:membrane-bound lytic murein transglycosylase F